MRDEVHKVSIINKNLPREAVAGKVSFEEYDFSFLEIGDHSVPTDDGNVWIILNDVSVTLLSVLDSLGNSFDLSAEEIGVFGLRKVIAVMVDRLGHFAFDIVK